MAQCPSCSKEVEVDFGIVICPHCQMALMFDIEGNPKIYEEVTSTHANVEELVLKEAGQILNSEPQAETETPNLEFNPGFETPLDETLQEDTPPLESSLQSEEFVSTQEEELFDPPAEETLSEDDEIIQNNIPLEGEVRFDDVIEFGNQELSGEALLYDVLIEEIDLSEIRSQIKDVLADSKLNLGFDIEKKIKSGVLKIEGINAIKASVIIHSCQALPVKISWRQYAVANV